MFGIRFLWQSLLLAPSSHRVVVSVVKTNACSLRTEKLVLNTEQKDFFSLIHTPLGWRHTNPLTLKRPNHMDVTTSNHRVYIYMYRTYRVGSTRTSTWAIVLIADANPSSLDDASTIMMINCIVMAKPAGQAAQGLSASPPGQAKLGG